MGETRKILTVVALALAFISVSCVRTMGRPLLLKPGDPKPAGAIVVLGSGPPVDRNGNPTTEVRWRVEKGVQLYRAGLAPLIIMTGGKTFKEYYEATVMKELAVKLGVPAEAVVEERDAMNTIDNARYTARILKEREITSIILVSNPYHLKRAAKLFQANGLEVQVAPYDHVLKGWPATRLIIYEYSVQLDYLRIDEEALARDHSPAPKGDR